MLKDTRFWTGVVVGLVLFWVWKNYAGKKGIGGIGG
jgi:hypothetical protein